MTASTTLSRRPLLTAAQHTREIRGDLTLEQILDMIVAIATIHGGAGYTGPILQAALDGLRPRPMPGPPGMSVPPASLGPEKTAQLTR